MENEIIDDTPCEHGKSVQDFRIICDTPKDEDFELAYALADEEEPLQDL